MLASAEKGGRTDPPRPEPVPEAAEKTSEPKAGAGWSQLALSRVQRKASVSEPGDPAEREADAVAEKVGRGSTAGAIQGSARSAVQAKGERAGAGPSPGSARAAMSTVSQGGEPLSPEARAYFEPRFGADFSDVRIHTGSEAASGAQGVQARAFTVGDHIAFASGKFAPGSPAGNGLLAHELTHVVQQRARGASEHDSPALVQRDAATVGKPAPEATEKLGGTLWAKDPSGKDLPPSLEDIAQGAVADCFLFAAMAAIVNTHPEQIKGMIKDNGDGTYTVTFKGIGFWSSAKQTVSADFVKGKHGNVGSRKALWPLIIEKAYAQQKGGIEAIGKGGSAGNAIDDIINDSASTFDPRTKTVDYILGKLTRAKEKKWPVVMGTPKKDDATAEKKEIADSTKGLYFWHGYVVIDVDGEKNRIRLFNPWGNDHPNGDGWIEVEKVKKFFISVQIND